MPILLTAIASDRDYRLATVHLADGTVTTLTTGPAGGPIAGAHPRRSPTL